MNSFECKECGGSGIGLHEPPDHPQPCPTCKGIGRMQLAARILNMTPCPARTCGCLVMYEYRPLTDDEVRELIDNLKPTGTTQYDPIALMMANIDKGVQKFKGSQVVLISKEA